MDDEGADIEAKMAAYEEYESSIAGKLLWFLRDLAEQTSTFELSSTALERALTEHRNNISAKWEKENAEMRNEILRRAKEAEMPGAGSFEELWRELSSVEPWEQTLRRELYDEWISFEHHFSMDHRAELSADTDSLLRYGVLISAYAILETRLGALCDVLRDYRKVALKVKDLRKGGGEVGRVRRYLDKVLGIQTADALWREIEVFVEIRQCIANHSGAVDKRLLSKYQKHFGPAGIADVHGGRLVLFPSTVTLFLQAIHELFDGLAHEVRHWGVLRLAEKTPIKTPSG